MALCSSLVRLAFPPVLAPGDLVAVVAPSSPFPLDELWRGLAWLRTRYRLRLRTALFSRSGFLAGDDDVRARDLEDAMRDDEVKAIVAARGGYGAMRVMGELPWDLFARRPKWIVGFSDVTALHAMAWRAGVASVHAPNVTGLGPARPPERAAWLASIERPARPRAWSGLRALHSGAAVGPVVGGNLALVHAMAAAGRLSVPSGAILALEDTGEAPYRVDRMLTSLRLGGHLSGAAGVVFGSFARSSPGPDGRRVDEVLAACTRPLGIPVVAGAPFGHAAPNEAFVLGAVASLAGDALTWT